jgi:hypothetical protein
MSLKGSGTRPKLFMLHRKLLTALTAVVLSTAGAGSLRAQGDNIVQTVSYNVTAMATTNWYKSGGIYKDKIIKVKVDTKVILELLGEATTNDFTGATLVLVNYGDAVQVRNGTNVLADVSAFFTEESDDDVWSGNYNDNTGQENYISYWTQRLGFDDGRGHRFTLNGLVTENFTASAANIGNIRQVSDKMTLKGSGTGEGEGEYFIVTGSVTTNGKGTDTW